MTTAPEPTRQERASSFGAVAEHYDRFRLGPVPAVADWLLQGHAGRVVDLGAGTGAMSRLLAERVDDLISVEPDPRMRAVLAATVPPATVLAGRGEDIPVDDESIDAVVVSSAWHWMDPGPTTAEIARVLHGGGILGVVWSGLDWQASGLGEVRRLMGWRPRGTPTDGADSGPAPDSPLAAVMAELPRQRHHVLELPPGAPFDPQDHAELRWSRCLDADQLIGMLGTFSGVITLPPARRATVLDEARRLVVQVGGLEDGASMEFPFRARCWRARRR
jgi:SAM-dependent methyltransferase